VHAKINAGERKRMNKPSREQREKTNEIDWEKKENRPGTTNHNEACIEVLEREVGRWYGTLTGWQRRKKKMMKLFIFSFQNKGRKLYRRYRHRSTYYVCVYSLLAEARHSNNQGEFQEPIFFTEAGSKTVENFRNLQSPETRVVTYRNPDFRRFWNFWNSWKKIF
jgi:hypothetical protein